MLDRIEELVSLCERRKIDRRALIKALMVAAATPTMAATAQAAPARRAPTESAFQGRIVNHVALNVQDVERSRAFYQALFGVGVMTDGSKQKAPFYDLRLRESFFGVIRGMEPGLMGPVAPGTISHFAVGVEPWTTPEDAAARVKKFFPELKVRIGTNVNAKAAGQRQFQSISLTDPDGIAVQIGPMGYHLDGASTSASPQGAESALFRGRILNHVALNVTDVDRSRAFYERLLGVSVMTDGGKDPKTPFYDFRMRDSFFGVIVSEPRGKAPGTIDHFAVGVDPWPGAAQALALVQKRFPESKPRTGENQWGKAVGQKEVTSLFMSDQDGIGVQISHMKYQLE